MSLDINKLPYTETLADMMFEAKQNELLQLADKYSISLDNLTGKLNEKLSESRMKLGGCNTAVDFLIVETLNNNKLYKSVEDAIRHNILAAGIYYVNAINKSEYVF
jgi:hypothetical protein